MLGPAASGFSLKIVLTLLFIAIIQISSILTKIYEPCELAKEMIEKHRFPKADIADCKFYTDELKNFD